MELITLCEELPPSTALALGLVNKLAADEEELALLTMDWARKLAKKDATTLHLVKTQFTALGHQTDLGDVTAYDNDLLLYTGMLNESASKL